MSKAKKIIAETIKPEALTLTNAELQKLFKLRKAIFQMCYDRGYKVSKFDLNEDFNEFSEYFQERSLPDLELNILLSHIYDINDKMYVMFNGYSLSYNHVEECKNKMIEASASKAIIVSESPTSSFNSKGLPYKIEVFTEGELLLNPINHILSPKYTPLNPEEKQHILTSEKFQLSQLPRIRLNDPVARYFGLERGDVIKLKEKNENGSHNVWYKVIF